LPSPEGFTQKTIFDQIEEKNLTWKGYYADIFDEVMYLGFFRNPENYKKLLKMD